MPPFLLQEISVVKGSGKVEQAKNKRNWETGKIVVKAEIIWKDKKAILLKQKKGRAAEGQSNGALRGLFRHQHQWILETLKHTLKHL